jgi:hypothetical protein
MRSGLEHLKVAFFQVANRMTMLVDGYDLDHDLARRNFENKWCLSWARLVECLPLTLRRLAVRRWRGL